jgi:arginyl-tRNA synthetase
MNVLQVLQQKLRQALVGLVDDPDRYAVMLKPAQDARFGDYQANCAMALAKVLGQPPRQIAQTISERLDRGDLLEAPEIAGPGFINLRLRADWLAQRLQDLARDERLGVEPARPARTVVLDYSSPNVAKPMHVGHLRSTIIGDALARLLRFLGHKVISDNHLGDWGTQFGMLLYGYKHQRDEVALARDPVQEMVRLYLLVRNEIRAAEAVEDDPENAKRYEAEELARSRQVLEAVRCETAKLHAGDAENLALWQKFIPWSNAEIEAIYRRLDIHFDHTHGESFYQPMLADVVHDLLDRGIACPSQGAVAVFFGEKQAPALVRKSDGAFTYTTSDLATIRYRMNEWCPDAILYVVGTPQSLHFRNLFAIARRWGYDKIELEHINFGSVQASSGKVMATREGGAPLLEELLDAAVARARQVVEANSPDLDPSAQQVVAEAVGIGAVKYADLSQNRTSDYVFDPDKMTAMDGNTATYMQYAYARNRSIFRKGDVDAEPLRTAPPLPQLETPYERALALQLVRFPEALESAAADYRPNLITNYLWDLARAYSGFFVNCPVLKAETPELRQGRLLLCDLTARVIQRGLDLLGIRTIERM